MLHPSVVVNVPTRPSDLPQSLDLDRHMVLAHVRRSLAHTINNALVRPGAEKLIKDAAGAYLNSLRARGAIDDFKVDGVTLESGTQQTFDEVTGLAPGTCPGDPYLDTCPETGQPRYGGIVVYSDGEGRGLVFRGHDGVRATGSDVAKVQVSVRATCALDYVVITVATGDPIDPAI